MSPVRSHDASTGCVQGDPSPSPFGPHGTGSAWKVGPKSSAPTIRTPRGLPGLPGLPGLLRDIFASAGGTHEDWAAYDAAMAEEQRAAVLIQPDRIYSNPSTP